MENSYRPIGKVIRECRRTAGISRRKLARNITSGGYPITHVTIRNVEAGKMSRVLTFDAIMRTFGRFEFRVRGGKIETRLAVDEGGQV